METTSEFSRLHELLALKNRIIDLIMAIDAIRDNCPNPSIMVQKIVALVADNFQTDLCLMALLNRETEQIEIQTIQQRPNLSADLIESMTKTELLTHAMDLQGVTIWKGVERPKQIIENQDSPNIEIAVVPIILKKHEPLGVMLLACREHSFSHDDVECLEYIEDHIDSAVIQGQNYYEMEHRNQQLELIYKIDRVRDEHLPIDQMLDTVVKILINEVPSEQGFAMTYDYGNNQLILRASTDDDHFTSRDFIGRITILAERTLREGRLIMRNGLPHEGMNSIMCLPLILNEKIIGVLGLINRKVPDGFSNKDMQLLTIAGSQIDTALYETMEKRHLRMVLGRAVGPRIMDRILQAKEDVLKSERMVLTVLYADIRGSTQLAEETEPETLVAFINDYLRSMTEIILNHEGTLDKFIGDEVMALFGAPISQSDHAYRAVKVAQEMQQAHAELVDRWNDEGINARPIGVGIATGELIAGEMGSSRRMSYTVMGQAANLGSRICGMAAGGEILMCPETYRLTQSKITANNLGAMEFKGIQEATEVYKLV
ncbi:MAG: adenylate/guanylate cyclase domain-containing protein [Anaerolineae bacterium]